MKGSQAGRLENQVYSNRVVRSEFDRNWRTVIAKSGYVIYIATSNRATAEVLLVDNSRKLLVFNKGGKVIVGGGGVRHYSKPHRAITL